MTSHLRFGQRYLWHAEHQEKRAYLAQLNIDVATKVAGFFDMFSQEWPVHLYLRPTEPGSEWNAGGNPYDQEVEESELPQFVIDLNECATLEEQIINEGHGSAYFAALQNLSGGDVGAMVRASAALRCEAMLKVMP